MVNDEYQLDIYKIDTKAKIDKKKLLLVILIILSIICIILTINYVNKTISEYKVYKQYEEQLNSIKYKEEQEAAKLAAELEKKKQEKIPKLTDTWKTKYRGNISFRY